MDVLQIQYTDRAFAALRADGAVVTWGDPEFGADSSSVREQLGPVQRGVKRRRTLQDAGDTLAGPEVR